MSEDVFGIKGWKMVSEFLDRARADQIENVREHIKELKANTEALGDSHNNIGYVEACNDVLNFLRAQLSTPTPEKEAPTNAQIISRAIHRMESPTPDSGLRSVVGRSVPNTQKSFSEHMGDIHALLTEVHSVLRKTHPEFVQEIISDLHFLKDAHNASNYSDENIARRLTDEVIGFERGWKKATAQAREIITMLMQGVDDDWTTTKKGDAAILRARAFLAKNPVSGEFRNAVIAHEGAKAMSDMTDEAVKVLKRDVRHGLGDTRGDRPKTDEVDAALARLEGVALVDREEAAKVAAEYHCNNSIRNGIASAIRAMPGGKNETEGKL